jgi:radical SAM protein
VRPDAGASVGALDDGQPVVRSVRFDDRPLLVFWEMTKACDLACMHCRACAQREPGDDELTTAEGRALINELASMGRPRPILILTGGDCLKRSDILELVAYARHCGVPVAIAPSVTPGLTLSTLRSLRELGVATASLSLDGASGSTHDRIRGIDGHFESTLQAIDLLQGLGFKVQINTTVMAANLGELPEVAALLKDHAVDIWEVFFLITTGRGTEVAGTTPEENEAVCHFLLDASRYGFTVRTVEAPFFRRVAAERKAGSLGDDDFAGRDLYLRLRRRTLDLLGLPSAPVRAPSAATRDGKGIIFVASNGDVSPSGFLPLSLGNVRSERLSKIYRESKLLKSIRAASFAGVCGSCEHAQLCGGSRSRAFAASNDPLGDDPGCVRVAAPSLVGA